jgi:hypothetical protein
MALAFIEQTSGPVTAAKVQMAAEYYPDGKLYGGDAMHGKAPAYVRR